MSTYVDTAREEDSAERYPDLLIAKIVLYLLSVRRLRIKYSHQPADKNNCLGGYGFRYNWVLLGNKAVSMKTIGHEKCCVTAGLAAKGDGTKLKPFIIFKTLRN